MTTTDSDHHPFAMQALREAARLDTARDDQGHPVWTWGAPPIDDLVQSFVATERARRSWAAIAAQVASGDDVATRIALGQGACCLPRAVVPTADPAARALQIAAAYAAASGRLRHRIATELRAAASRA